MEIDITRIARIARLLGRIEEARRQASELPDGHAGRGELEARANLLYLEVGRYVHWLLRQDPEAIERVRVEGMQWAGKIEEELGIQPLPDVLPIGVVESEEDRSEASVGPSMELTADSRLGAVDVRDLPEPAEVALASGAVQALSSGSVPALTSGAMEALPASKPSALASSGSLPALESAAHPPRASTPPKPAAAPRAVRLKEPLPDIAEDPAPISDVSPIPAAEEGGVDDFLEEPTNVGQGDDDEGGDLELEPGEVSGREARISVGVARPAQEDLAEDWISALSAALSLLGAPDALPDDESSRVSMVRSVVKVTTNFEVRWSVFPDAVQQALLGLVGARVRRLQWAVGEDPDLKLALGRMRRFSEQRGLMVVPSLRPGQPPARDWAADERRYWNVLRAGL